MVLYATRKNASERMHYYYERFCLLMGYLFTEDYLAKSMYVTPGAAFI